MKKILKHLKKRMKNMDTFKMSGGSISKLLTFNVSSINRIQDNSDTDNFNYFINLPQDLDEFTHVSITNWQLPKSWYVVRTPLNDFVLNENGTMITINFPEGNYTNIQLFQAFQDLLNANSPNGFIYTINEVNSISLGVYPVPDLNQIEVTNNGTGIIQFIFNDETSIINLLLGYNTGVNNQIPGGTTIAPQLYNLNFESQVYMISNIVSNESNDNNYSNNTLCVINVADKPYGDYINQSYDLISNMKRFNNTGNRTYNFQLVTDNNENSFFLNFVDMKFTLCIFKYTPNYNYYIKSTELLEIIALRR